jgi:hypothetical protein
MTHSGSTDGTSNQSDWICASDWKREFQNRDQTTFGYSDEAGFHYVASGKTAPLSSRSGLIVQ